MIGRLVICLIAVTVGVILTQATKSSYVPLRCMTAMTVVDWGKGCTRADDGRWDCPNVHVTFLEGCVGTKPGAETEDKKVQYPTAIQEGKP